MRYGLLNLYPVSVGMDNPAANNTGENAIKYNEGQKNNEHCGKVNENKTQVSVFSSFDTNSDGTVNVGEAKNYNLFQQANLNQEASSLSSVSDANVKNKIKSMALKDFDMGSIFSKAVDSNFKDLTNLTKTITTSAFVWNKSNSAKDSSMESEIGNIRRDFDRTVKSEVKKVTDIANKAVQDAYETAIEAAKQKLESDETAGDDIKILSDKQINSKLTAKNKEEEVGNLNNIEITKTAFSTYDQDTSGSVGKGEINYQPLNADKFIKSSYSDALKNSLREQITKYNSTRQNEFSVATGSLDVKGTTAEEVNKKVQDFAKQADKQVDTEVKQFTSQLDKEIKDLVNQSVKSFGNGVENNKLDNLDESRLSPQLFTRVEVDADNLVLNPGPNTQPGTVAEPAQHNSGDVPVENNNPQAPQANGEYKKNNSYEIDGKKYTCISNDGDLFRGADGQGYVLENGKLTPLGGTILNEVEVVGSKPAAKPINGSNPSSEAKPTDEVSSSSGSGKSEPIPVNLSQIAQNRNEIAGGNNSLNIGIFIALVVLDTLSQIFTDYSGKSDIQIDSLNFAKSDDSFSKNIYQQCRDGGLDAKVATFVSTPSNHATPNFDDSGKVVSVEVQDNNGQKIIIKKDELDKYVKEHASK